MKTLFVLLVLTLGWIGWIVWHYPWQPRAEEVGLFPEQRPVGAAEQLALLCANYCLAVCGPPDEETPITEGGN